MKDKKNMKLLQVNLRLFANANTQTTNQLSLSAEMRTFYDKRLIQLAEAELVHNQFGQKRPIPENNGKTIQFRRFDQLPEATAALTEGVTPDGQSVSMSTVQATVSQYGGYVTISDLLDLTAVDNMILEATKLIASQAGRTLDTITREVLNSGTNVQYASGQVGVRTALYYNSAGDNCNLTAAAVRKAVRTLEAQDVPKIDGYYIGIIHPYVKYDLMSDPEWRNPHEYVNTEHIYKGEIGELFGVRFVETSRAKVFHGADLCSASRALTVTAAATNSATVSVSESLVSGALKGRQILVNGLKRTVLNNGTSTLSLDAVVTVTVGNKIWPGEGGAGGADVYCTLILGDEAYGVTEIEGGGLKHIVKQLGSAGSGDPLDQRATVGWKATHTAELLVPQYVVRVETTATK